MTIYQKANRVKGTKQRQVKTVQVFNRTNQSIFINVCDYDHICIDISDDPIKSNHSNPTEIKPSLSRWVEVPIRSD